MKVKNTFKQVLIPSVLIFAAVFFASGVAFSEDIELGGEKDRGVVAFPHEDHMSMYECLDCHHIMENGENVLDESDLSEDNPETYCGTCHDAAAKIQRREAFHYQCMKCHKTEKAGPTLCGECHVLEK